MIELNKTSVRTSNNFFVNSFLFDEKKLDVKFKKSNDTKILNAQNCEQQNKSNFTLCYNTYNESQTPTFERTLTLTKSQSKPIFVNLKSNNPQFIKLKIVVAEKVSQKIVLDFELKNFLKTEILFELEKNANLDVVFLCSGCCKNFCSIQNNIKDDAFLKLTVCDFCEDVSLYNVFSQNEKKNSKFFLNFLYTKQNASKIDLNFLAENKGQKSETNINVLGSLSNIAEKSFKGIIDFKKGAKKSIGSEQEFAILQNSGVISRSMPTLLCGEEDVVGFHSSSSGKLDEEALFYVTSRGLDMCEAKKLLTKAKFNIILNEIFDLDIKQKIIEKIDRSIESDK